MNTQTTLSDYTIGWICALYTKLATALKMLDERHAPLSVGRSDQNSYIFGRMGKHNVDIECLYLGQKGAVSAATVARDMDYSFKNLRFALMVGIGGGVPSDEDDIRLGDVFSSPGKEYNGVIQYDMGKTETGGHFTRNGKLNAPPQILLAAPSLMMTNYEVKETKISTHLQSIALSLPQYAYPGTEKDLPFRADYPHTDGKTCNGCDRARLVQRNSRSSSDIGIHYGTIASANQVMKDSITSGSA